MRFSSIESLINEPPGHFFPIYFLASSLQYTLVEIPKRVQEYSKSCSVKEFIFLRNVNAVSFSCSNEWFGDYSTHFTHIKVSIGNLSHPPSHFIFLLFPFLPLSSPLNGHLTVERAEGGDYFVCDDVVLFCL